MISSITNGETPPVLPGFYISPTGDDVVGDGSYSNPWFSFNTAWPNLLAGDTLYCMGGTYSFTAQQNLNGLNGALGNRINIWAYPGETPNFTKAGPLAPINPAALIYFTGDYFYFKGLEISDYAQENNLVWNGFRAYDSNHNIFELINVHHCGGGFLVEGDSDDNLLLNVDSHDNFDPLSGTPYGNSDGIQFMDITVGNDDNIARGCRAWYNGDDGFDLWHSDGYITLDKCWSWSNGYEEDHVTPGGDGGGFKLGPSTVLTNADWGRTIQNCITVLNRNFGFVDNTEPSKMRFWNNVCNFQPRGWRFFLTTTAHEIRNNEWYGNTVYDWGEDLPNAVFSNNSFNAFVEPAGVVTDATDFVSIVNTLANARQADGSLPLLTYMHLVAGSDLRGAGVAIPGLLTDGDGVAWNDPPSIGSYEFVP